MTQEGITISKIIQQEMPQVFSKERLEELDHCEKLIQSKFTGHCKNDRIWIEGNLICKESNPTGRDLCHDIRIIMENYRKDIFNKFLFHPDVYGKYVLGEILDNESLYN